MTEDGFRDVLLALEGVEEHAHMGHPDFRLPPVRTSHHLFIT